MADKYEMLSYALMLNFHSFILRTSLTNLPRENRFRKATELMFSFTSWMMIYFTTSYVRFTDVNYITTTGCYVLNIATTIACILVVSPWVDHLENFKSIQIYYLHLYNIAIILILISQDIITMCPTTIAAVCTISLLVAGVHELLPAMESMIVMHAGWALCTVLAHFYFHQFDLFTVLFTQCLLLAPYVDICNLLILTMPATQLLFNIVRNVQPVTYGLPMWNTYKTILSAVPIVSVNGTHEAISPLLYGPSENYFTMA